MVRRRSGACCYGSGHILAVNVLRVESFHATNEGLNVAEDVRRILREKKGVTDRVREGKKTVDDRSSAI